MSDRRNDSSLPNRVPRQFSALRARGANANVGRGRGNSQRMALLAGQQRSLRGAVRAPTTRSRGRNRGQPVAAPVRDRQERLQRFRMMRAQDVAFERFRSLRARQRRRQLQMRPRLDSREQQQMRSENRARLRREQLRDLARRGREQERREAEEEKHDEDFDEDEFFEEFDPPDLGLPQPGPAPAIDPLQVMFTPPRTPANPLPLNQPLGNQQVPCVETYRKGTIRASALAQDGGDSSVLGSPAGANTATNYFYQVRDGNAVVSLADFAEAIWRTWREQGARFNAYFQNNGVQIPAVFPIASVNATYVDVNGQQQQFAFPLSAPVLNGTLQAFTQALNDANGQAILGDLVRVGDQYDEERARVATFLTTAFNIYTPWRAPPVGVQQQPGGALRRNESFIGGYVLRSVRNPVDGACFFQALHALSAIERPKATCLAWGWSWGTPIAPADASALLARQRLEVGIVVPECEFVSSFHRDEQFDPTSVRADNIMQHLRLELTARHRYLYNPLAGSGADPSYLLLFHDAHYYPVVRAQPFEQTCEVTGEDLSPYYRNPSSPLRHIPMKVSRSKPGQEALPSLVTVLQNRGVLEIGGRRRARRRQQRAGENFVQVEEGIRSVAGGGGRGVFQRDERPTKFIFFDFETTSDSRTGLIRPYSVQAIMGTISDDGVFSIDADRSLYHVGYDSAEVLWQRVFRGWTTDAQFKYSAFGFNNARFDNQLLMQHIVKIMQNIPGGPKLLITDSAILTIQVGDVQIRDIMRLLGPTSLKKACQDFNTNTRKGECDHDEIQMWYEEAVEAERTNEPEAFITRMKESAAAESYGMADVICLAELAAIIHASWRECCPTADPILEQLTIAGAVFQAWRAHGGDSFTDDVCAIQTKKSAFWLRSGLVGGRCEISPELDKCRAKWQEPERSDPFTYRFPIPEDELDEVFGDCIQSFDVKSLYPYAMLGEFPAGRETNTKVFVPGKPGFYQVELLRQPTPNIYPYRPPEGGVWEWQKQDSRYMVGNPEPFLCIMSNLELEMMNPADYRLVPRRFKMLDDELSRRRAEVLMNQNLTPDERAERMRTIDREAETTADPDGYVGIFWSRTAPVFRDFLVGLKSLKTKHDDFKAAFQMDLYNAGVRNMAKLAMNSLSGKQIQRKFLKDKQLIWSYDAMGKFEATHNNIAIQPIGGEARCWLVTGSRNNFQYRPWAKKRIEYPWHLGFFIYARSRFHMYNAALRPLAHSFRYTDTDSIHCKMRDVRDYVARMKADGTYGRGFGKFFLGGKFGDFECEMEYPADQYLYLYKKCYNIRMSRPVRACKKIFKHQMMRSMMIYLGATELKEIEDPPEACMRAECEHVDVWRPVKKAWKGVMPKSKYMAKSKTELLGSKESPRLLADVRADINAAPNALEWVNFQRLARGEKVRVVSMQFRRHQYSNGRFAPINAQVNFREYVPPELAASESEDRRQRRERGEPVTVDEDWGRQEEDPGLSTDWWNPLDEAAFEERRRHELAELNRQKDLFERNLPSMQVALERLRRRDLRTANRADVSLRTRRPCQERLLNPALAAQHLNALRIFPRQFRIDELNAYFANNDANDFVVVDAMEM